LLGEEGRYFSTFNCDS